MKNWFVIYHNQNTGISILINTNFNEMGEILEKAVNNLCNVHVN